MHLPIIHEITCQPPKKNTKHFKIYFNIFFCWVWLPVEVWIGKYRQKLLKCQFFLVSQSLFQNCIRLVTLHIAFSINLYTQIERQLYLKNRNFDLDLFSHCFIYFLGVLDSRIQNVLHENKDIWLCSARTQFCQSMDLL